MSIIQKLYRGDDLRKSRLHDEKGNFTGWKNILMHMPPAVITGFMRLSFDYRPKQPWIAYSAIHSLNKFLKKEHRVLEYGSGMSTIWYAQKAGNVYSVEDYKPWYSKVNEILVNKNIQNVHYKYAENPESYSSFMSDNDTGFDLIVVDGSYRSQCMMSAFFLIKPGGIIYLDNSDKDSTPSGGDMRLAESYARNFAQEQGADIKEFVDFAPTQFFVQQGLLIKMPENRTTDTGDRKKHLSSRARAPVPTGRERIP